MVPNITLSNYGEGGAPEPALRLFWPPHRASMSVVPRGAKKRLRSVPPDPGGEPKRRWGQAVLCGMRGRLGIVERYRVGGQARKGVYQFTAVSGLRLTRLPNNIGWIGVGATSASSMLPGGGQVLILIIPKTSLHRQWSHVWLWKGPTQGANSASGSKIDPEQRELST